MNTKNLSYMFILDKDGAPFWPGNGANVPSVK